MGVVSTTNGAINNIGSTRIGNYPYSDRSEVMFSTPSMNYSGDKKQSKPAYQSGSFGVKPDTMIGAKDAFEGSIVARPATMIGAKDWFSGSTDPSQDETLQKLAASITTAQTTVIDIQQDVSFWETKLTEARNAEGIAFAEWNKQKAEREACCGVCFKCKAENNKDIEVTRVRYESSVGVRQNAEQSLSEFKSDLATAQQTLSDAVSLHAERLSEIKKIAAAEAIEALRAQSQLGLQEVQKEQISAATDPNVLAAKLEQSKQKSQTTMIIIAAAVVGIIVLSRFFK